MLFIHRHMSEMISHKCATTLTLVHHRSSYSADHAKALWCHLTYLAMAM